MRLFASFLLNLVALVFAFWGAIGLLFWFGYITGLLSPPVIGYIHPWWEPFPGATMIGISFPVRGWGTRLAVVPQRLEPQMGDSHSTR